MWDGHLWSIKAVQPRVKLEKADNRPNHSTPFCAGSKAKEFMKQERDQMSAMVAIEHVQTELASPNVFVSNMDGTLRICVDYCNLNAAMIRDSYTIPCMDKCIASASKALIFLTLDANCGYWKAKIVIRKIRKEPPLHPLMVFSVMPACPSDWKMHHRRFNKQWTSNWRVSSGNLPFSVSRISSYFCICQTDGSIMFDSYWRYYTTWAWPWIRKCDF